MSKSLFDEVSLGSLTLPNRIFMAPLTRSRANRAFEIQPISETYYAQRADAGLIITEATNISHQAVGYAYTPGIFTARQTAGWAKVTDAVHAAGGRIFLQLWHVGRISHPDMQPGGGLPVAPSALQPKGEAFTYEGMKPHPEPRALDLSELAGIVEDYRVAAENAQFAGFDGVEIHAANGYLLDQFLRDHTNRRTDDYGGTVENRARLLSDVIEAVSGVWSPTQMGVRLSPNTDFGDIRDSDPVTTFSHAVDVINTHKLGYLHLVEDFPGMAGQLDTMVETKTLRDRFDGLMIVNGGYDKAKGNQVIADGSADAVTFGRPFLANPDLVKRYLTDAPLNDPDQSTFYGGGAEGYTDYPTLEDQAA
ncbi:MAG: alkene reductase [Pseudomonadota bacterium]